MTEAELDKLLAEMGLDLSLADRSLVLLGARADRELVERLRAYLAEAE